MVPSQPVGFRPRGCCGAGHELLNLFISRLRLLLLDQFHLRCGSRNMREIRSDVGGLRINHIPFQSSKQKWIGIFRRTILQIPPSRGGGNGCYWVFTIVFITFRAPHRCSLLTLFWRMMMCFKRIISWQASKFPVRAKVGAELPSFPIGTKALPRPNARRSGAVGRFRCLQAEIKSWPPSASEMPFSCFNFRHICSSFLVFGGFLTWGYCTPKSST